MYDWKKEFHSRILERGLDYYQSGKIRSLNTLAVSINGDGCIACSAEVEGSETYKVSIEAGGLRVRKMSCTCPYAEEDGEHCKHMAAVLYKLEEEGKLPFLAEREEDGETSEEDVLLSVLKARLLADELMDEDQFDRAIESWKEEFQVTVTDAESEPAEEDFEDDSFEDEPVKDKFEGVNLLDADNLDDAWWKDFIAKAEEESEPETVTEQERGADREAEEDPRSLEELLAELDSLVGLDMVKQDIHTLINFVKINQVRAERGLKTADISYHLVFSGNPGTGKTTVARLLAKLYQKIGVLSSGHLVEVDRSRLVAGFLGQTAIKTAEVIEEAMGGVLFIDEAYSLAQDEQDGYGKECISTILKAMEDHRDDLVVIVAGYDDLMHKFIDSNPGLKSRFNKYFNFPDYTGEEMEKIFLLQCKNNGYQVGPDAQAMLRECFDRMYAERDDNFGNGRDVRNIFENIINAQANRLVSDPDLTTEELLELTAEDVEKVVGRENNHARLEP